MACNSRIKQLICRRIIGQNSVNTILRFIGANGVRGEPVYDEYGEGEQSDFTSRPIRIAPRQDQRDEINSGAGAYPDPAKEFFKFYAESNEDIRINDKLVWPPGGTDEWAIDVVNGVYSGGELIILECKAGRDPRK